MGSGGGRARSLPLFGFWVGCPLLPELEPPGRELLLYFKSNFPSSDSKVIV